ncbi:MAG: TetR family transcriptional regulator [Candidatus Krumholzibacteriia bacterium]
MTTAPQTPRRHDTVATRTALMRAALPLFAQRGFAGTTVEAIAGAARVNKALINYHFGGKQGLFTAILGDALSAAEARIRPLAADARPADRRLREFVRIWAAAAADTPEFPALMMRELIAGGQHLEAGFFARIVAIFGTVRDIIADGVRDGQFRPVDPLLTHLSVVGSLMFFFATEPARERLFELGRPEAARPTREAFARHLEDLITVGLAPSAGDRPGGAAV